MISAIDQSGSPTHLLLHFFQVRWGLETLSSHRHLDFCQRIYFHTQTTWKRGKCTQPPPTSLFGGSRYTLAETQAVGGGALAEIRPMRPPWTSVQSLGRGGIIRVRGNFTTVSCYAFAEERDYKHQWTIGGRHSLHQPAFQPQSMIKILFVKTFRTNSLPPNFSTLCLGKMIFLLLLQSPNCLFWRLNLFASTTRLYFPSGLNFLHHACVWPT